MQFSHFLRARRVDLLFKLYLDSHNLLRGKVNYKLMRVITVAAVRGDVFFSHVKIARPFPIALKICPNFDFKTSLLKTETLFGL